MGIRRNKTIVEQATEARRGCLRERSGEPRASDRRGDGDGRGGVRGRQGEGRPDGRRRPGQGRAAASPPAQRLRAKGAAAAADLAAQKAAEGRDLANAKAADLEGKGKKKHRLRTFVIFAGLATALGFVVKKLTSGSGQDNWQSSYTPSPPPSATTSDTPIADAAAAASAEQADDEAGASPDEALADAVEEQHPVTTPDDPAEVVDLAPGEEAAEKPARKP